MKYKRGRIERTYQAREDYMKSSGILIILAILFLSGCTSTESEYTKKEVMVAAKGVSLIARGIDVDRRYANIGKNTNYGAAMITGVALLPILKDVTTLPSGESIFTADPTVIHTTNQNIIVDAIIRFTKPPFIKDKFSNLKIVRDVQDKYVYVEHSKGRVLLKNKKSNENIEILIVPLNEKSTKIIYPKTEDGFWSSTMGSFSAFIRVMYEKGFL